MTEETQSLAESITKQIIDAKSEPGDLAGDVEEITRSFLAQALREADDATDPQTLVEEVGRGVAESLKKVSPTWHAARGALSGVLKGSMAAKVDAFESIEKLTTILVESTLATDADFGAAAKGAVIGALEGAEARGLDEPRAGSRAASVAFAVAHATRPSAGVRVKDIIGDRVAGIPIKIA